MSTSLLKSVKISGFKSIKEMDLKLKSLNVLIGANGSGKSNFISLFTLLRHLSEEKLKVYVERNGCAGAFFHFGPKKTARIAIDLDLGMNGYHAEFGHADYDDSLVFESEYCTFKARAFHVKGKPGESGLLPGSDADSKKVREHTLEYMKKCRVYHFHDTSPTAAFKQAHPIDSSLILQHDAGNLAVVLYRMQKDHPREYRQILMSIQTIAPFFRDFHFEPNGGKGRESMLLRWIHRDHDEPFSASQLSDGTARFISLATLFLQPDTASKPDTIVLDEPELGLHPDAMEILAEIVKSVSDTRQVIVSTQSVEFANHFEPQDFIVVDEQKGASTFRRIDPEALDAWLDEYKMGTIWTKNIIGGNPKC